jgi:diguanylate cyclase (GGDEF)-like protein
MEFEVQGGGWAKTIVDVSALEPRPILGGRVTIVTPHQADVSAIEQVLADDGLVITSAMDGQGAMETAAASSPDLIILNSALPDGDGASFVQSLRDLAQRPDLPVILLTEGRDHTQTLYSGDSGATDYLARPFSPPMLRARVRAWLARTIGATGKSIQFVVAAHAPDLLDEHDEEETSSESLTQILISTPLLAPLGPEQLEQLRARSVEQRFPADHMIIRQDDPGRMVYLIVSGHVRVFESVPDSSVEMFLGELGPGEIFGESGALGERPRSASVVTLEQTHCLAIPASDFLSLLFESKEMSLALLRTLSGRLHDADRLLARHAPDSLTGLPGRRAFHELYRRVTARSRRRGTSVLLLVLDVVHLKDINDRFGYAVGDDVLRTVADSLMESSRTMDLVTRYGGDEFTVLLIDAAVHDADMILSRVHQKLQQLAVYRNLPIPVECRMGYAFNDNPPDGPEELLRTADEDMQCKRSSSAK